MDEQEITYFKDAFILAEQEFYLESISKFEKLIKEFPESELADDSYYNIGLCYFHMNQLEDAIHAFENIMTYYPDATISTLDSDQEFGKTAAKAYLGMVNCYLGLDNPEKAKETAEFIKAYDDDTYVLIDGKKSTFEELAQESISKYDELIRNQ